MRLNKRLTIAIAVMSGLSLLTIGAIAIPTILSIQKLRTGIANQYQEIEDRYNMRRQTRISLEALSGMGEKIDRLLGMVIVEGKELNFISSLEETAAESGVRQELSLETVNQKEISAWEREIPLKIKLTGTYREAIGYLQRLQSLPYFIAVSSLDIGSPAQRQTPRREETELTVELRGNVRWLSKKHPIMNKINPEDFQETMKEPIE